MTVIRWRMRIACWLTKTTVTHSEYIGCPTRYRTRHLFNKFTTNEQLGALQTHTIDTLLFISHTTNVLLFKFRCNILIGVRIIKEMSGSVANGTPCIIIIALPRLQRLYHCTSMLRYRYSVSFIVTYQLWFSYCVNWRFCEYSHKGTGTLQIWNKYIILHRFLALGFLPTRLKIGR